MPTYTAADKLACVEREIKMRRRVYPKWVEVERMSQDKADMEIACMEAIRDDYKALAEAERAEGDLFGGRP